MKKNFLLLLLIFTIGALPKATFAQYCTTSGGFTINPPKGCAPLTVKLQNKVKDATNLGYYYNFDRNINELPNTNPITDSSFIYNLPGVYSILQVGSASGTGFNNCDDVTVLETRAHKAIFYTCSNGRARVTLEADDILKAYDFVEIDWADGSPKQKRWEDGPLSFDHIYQDGTTIPAVKVTGGYDDGSCSAENRTTVLVGQIAAPSVAAIRITSVEMMADGRVKIVYEGLENVFSKVMFGVGSDDFQDSGIRSEKGGSQTVFINNLDPTQLYRFRLDSKDLCQNTFSSATVSSLVVKEGALKLDEIVSVEWKTLPNTEPLIQYQLKRDGKVIFTSPTALSYLDKEAKCGQTYKYELIALLNNNVLSYSTFINITSTATVPEKISSAYVNVTGNNEITTTVDLTGTGLTSTYDLIIQRSENGLSQYTKVSPDKNQSLTFIDNNTNTTAQSYCYRFSYTNSCKLVSPWSDPVCSVLLEFDPVGIKWSDDRPFLSNGVSYYVVKTDKNGHLVDEKPKGQELFDQVSLADQSTEDYTYKIKAVSDEGAISYSNEIKFKRDLVLQIPDVFTPNSDGINDIFSVNAYFASTFEMLIYDRWGKVIFFSNNPSSGWNGQLEGNDVPAGYYLYKITATDVEQVNSVHTGSFLLLR